MEYEFYMDFLEEEDSIEVEGDDTEIFAEDLDIDIWAEYKLDIDGEKYRLTIKEDAAPNSGNANYSVRLSEKSKLGIDEGYTNWKKTFEKEYSRVNPSDFKASLEQDLSEEIPVNLDI